MSFPQSGPQTVAGLTFDQARQQIKKRVSEQYIGVQASVSLGELRSMRVFVLGLVITIALRYAPKGLIPEQVRREG